MTPGHVTGFLSHPTVLYPKVPYLTVQYSYSRILGEVTVWYGRNLKMRLRTYGRSLATSHLPWLHVIFCGFKLSFII